MRDLGSAGRLLIRDEGDGERSGEAPPSKAPSGKRGAQARRHGEDLRFIENQLIAVQMAVRESPDLKSAEDIPKIALTHFKEAALAHPGEPRFKYLLGLAHLLNAAPEKGRAIFLALTKADPLFLPGWKGLALSWESGENRKKALEALERLKDSQIEGPYGSVLVAEFLLEIERAEEAMKVLRHTRKRFPGYAEPLAKLAEIHGAKKRWEAAFDAMSKAVQIAPKEAGMWFRKAKLHLTRARELEKDIRNPSSRTAVQEHKTLFRDALVKARDLDPGSPIGRACNEEIRNFDEPLRPLKQLVFNEKRPLPEREEALRALGRNAQAAGIDFFRKALRLPERSLRVRALLTLPALRSREAFFEIVLVLSQGEPDLRPQAAAALRYFQGADEALAGRLGPVAVLALIQALEKCEADHASAASEEEKDRRGYAFLDILDVLPKFAGVHFGEGRGDHDEGEAMKRTVAEWKKWWAENDSEARKKVLADWEAWKRERRNP